MGSTGYHSAKKASWYGALSLPPSQRRVTRSLATASLFGLESTANTMEAALGGGLVAYYRNMCALCGEPFYGKFCGACGA